MTLFHSQKLEQLLASQWASYIDRTKLLAIVLETSRDADFPMVEVPAPPKKQGVQLSVSRAEFSEKGLLLWTEFQIAKDDNTLVMGTSEIHVLFDGEVSKVESVGRVLTYST